MFDPKISALVAVIAFFLSLFFGIVVGAAFFIALLRASLFALFFFVFSGIAYWLITQFIPELLESQNNNVSATETEISDLGSKVNISVGDDDTIPENPLDSHLEAETAKEDEFILEKALDQNVEDGYTNQEYDTVHSESSEESSPSPALPPGGVYDIDELPDLEGMSDAFVMPITGVGDEDRETPIGVHVSHSSKKAGASASFDPKEMAMAIQTILKRDQKG